MTESCRLPRLWRAACGVRTMVTAGSLRAMQGRRLCRHRMGKPAGRAGAVHYVLGGHGRPLVARSSGTVLCCVYPCECVAVTYACAQVQSSVDADFAVLLDRETVMPSALDGGRPSCAVSLGIPPHGSCDAIAAVDKLYIRLYACNAFGASAPALANGGDGVLRLMAPPHPREVVLRSIGLLRLEVQWTSAAGSAVMPIDAFVVQCADEPHFHTVTEFRVKPVRSGATALPPATRPPHACTHTRASKCSRALAEWWV